MKQFAKICLMICGCSLILGMLFLGIGVSMGAKPGQYLSVVHFGHWTDLFHLDRTVKSLDEIEDILDRDAEEWADNLEKDAEKWADNLEKDAKEWADDLEGSSHHKEEYDHDSWHEGVTISPLENCEYDESFTEEIREVKIEVGYGAIQFIPYEGNDIRVQADNIRKYFQCWVKGKELHIQDHRKSIDEELDLMVYLPEKEYEELKVELGAGQFVAQELKAEEIELQMGAGECVVQRIEVKKEAELQVGAGRIWLGAFSGEKLIGDCAAGELDICLEGSYEDYNYDIESAVGEVLLDGKSHTGLAYVEKINNKANKKVELDCAVGMIQVSFRDGQ